jgi:hypothetical protein
MLVQLEVNGLTVGVALDEGDDIDSAMELVSQIKALAEQLSDYDGVEVYIASPVEEEEVEEEEYEEDE